MDAKGWNERALAIIRKLDDGRGAPWDAVISEIMEAGLSELGAEEALDTLLGAGWVYEPILGRIRVV